MARKNDYDYLFFLDDDNPPLDEFALINLYKMAKDIASGIVPIRHQDSDKMKYNFYEKKLKTNGNYSYKNIKKIPKKAEKVDLVTAACCLLSKEVIHRMYDEYIGNPFEMKTMQLIKKNDGTFMEDRVQEWTKDIKDIKRDHQIYPAVWSEDFVFFDRADRMGFEQWINPNVLCRHIGNPYFIEPK